MIIYSEIHQLVAFNLLCIDHCYPLMHQHDTFKNNNQIELHQMAPYALNIQ
jgi:hypothetical protein